MSNLKSIILLLFIFFSLTNLRTQNHANSWMRATLSIPVKERFKIDTELQHRRQNGYQNNNLLDKNLAYSYRNWIHYQQNKGLKFSFSPFAYYSNYHIIRFEADEHANPNSEVRFSAATELNHEIVNRFNIIGRTALEYRIFEKHHQDGLRFRNRFGLQYKVSKEWKIVSFIEVLVNLSGVTPTHFMDQNRFEGNLEYQATPNLKLELGYLFISRLPKTTIQKIGENTFFLNLTYTLSKRMKD
jgi:hypothetical protein